ncbi:MAG: isoprenylcysteine carboxylmethyltransferase family protein, partial [Alphaproteobacteria bacterium]|nr:isoprenylcysteine carboxylmethyltransferase family protein [Alphaproteobacteria bacterium]
GLVAIQKEHKLVTTGIYATIRHPSYLGLLITVAGWALVFRSGVGLIIAALFVPIILGRITAEERLLASQFGAQYEAYRARTSRLIPGVLGVKSEAHPGFECADDELVSSWHI